MRSDFKSGLHDGLPICLGYLSVAFAFGIFAVSKGLTGFETVLISMTNVTSAGQLAGVPIIINGGTFIELAVTQLVINLRYALMSISLSQKLDGSVRLRDRFLIAFINTDEVFAVSSAHEGLCSKKYMYGIIIPPYIGWSLGTFLGVIAGSLLPDIVISALGIAIYGMFIAIIVPQAKKSYRTALCILVAVALGCCFEYIPFLSSISDGFVIIICAVLASVLFAIVAPIKLDEESEDENG